MFERRLYYHIDWALLGAILSLCALGVTMIYSTTFDPTRGMSRLYLTQLYAIALGLGAMVFILMLDYRTFTDKSHLIYIGLLVLLLAGIVLIFVHIPHASLIYAVLGLVIFAGLTAADFQRLRRSGNMDSAPLIAASIFLDALNVFLFFLRIFSRSN